MDIDPSHLQWAALAVLLALSGFFSMSETALVSVDRAELRGATDKGDKRARRLVSVLDEPERLLTTILLGNNLVNIAAASLATAIAIDRLGPGSLGIAAATGIMTFVVLVFAEITPKSIAVRRAMPIALAVAIPLKVFEAILWPLVILLTAISKAMLRIVGIRTDEKVPFVTQAQIEGLVAMGAEEGEVEAFEEHVISEVFEFTETAVEVIMTPRDKVVKVGKDDTMRKALEVSARTGFSRLPVVDGTFDHVLGFVHVKDLLRFTDQELANEPVTDILRGVLFTQHDTSADKVLVRMQREHKLMAVIQDEHGMNVGISTAEDLLEELVGEITDEFDRPVAK